MTTTRPTDAELEAGHARLQALDKTLTITHYKVPYVMTSEEVEQARAAQATVAKWNWPELKAYYDVQGARVDGDAATAGASLQGVMDIAVQAQAAGIEWQGRPLADVAADLEDTILDTFGARGPDFAELEAKAIERMTEADRWAAAAEGAGPRGPDTLLQAWLEADRTAHDKETP